MVADENGSFCTYGNRVCLETLASATGIVNLEKICAIDHPLADGLKDLILSDEATAKDLFDDAKKDNQFPNQIIEKFSTYLGKSLSQLAKALNLDHIVIGGGVSVAGDYLLDKVNKEFQKYALPSVRASTSLALATLGNDAGVIEAASLVP